MTTPRTRTFAGGPVLLLTAVAALVLSPGPVAAGADRAGPLPGSFTWSSTGPLIGSEPDATHPIVSVKDPTVFRYGNRRQVSSTTADTSGRWSIGHTSFADWSQAAAAPQTSTASAVRGST